MFQPVEGEKGEPGTSRGWLSLSRGRLISNRAECFGPPRPVSGR